MENTHAYNLLILNAENERYNTYNREEHKLLQKLLWIISIEVSKVSWKCINKID